MSPFSHCASGNLFPTLFGCLLGWVKKSKVVERNRRGAENTEGSVDSSRDFFQKFWTMFRAASTALKFENFGIG